jgi:hypothetical protein
MDRTLAFWADAEINRIQSMEKPDVVYSEALRTVLRNLEQCGYARRTLDRKGRLSWQSTPALEQYLRDCELDAFFDDQDD